jgi:hypothetical protein
MRKPLIFLPFFFLFGCSGEQVVVMPEEQPKTNMPSGKHVAACGEPLLVTDRTQSTLLSDYLIENGQLVPPSSCKAGDGLSPLLSVDVAPFFLDKWEVTNQCYQQCVSDGACQEPTVDAVDPTPGTWLDQEQKLLPVGGINYYQAKAFCQWRGGRLPSWAELNYAMLGSQETYNSLSLSHQVVDCSLGISTDNCSTILAQGKLRFPTSAEDNARRKAVGTWSPLDQSLIGVEDLFGGVPEWTRTSREQSDYCTSTKAYDTYSDEFESEYHVVFSPAGEVRGVQLKFENGVRFGFVIVTSLPNNYLSYGLGFRCSFPAE